MFDITVTIIFHREGAYALPALASMFDLVSEARSIGLKVETRAILDKPDEHTSELVSARGGWLDYIDYVSFGDLGLTRNSGVQEATGEYLAFLDGDDLWGSDWLKLAYKAAMRHESPRDTVWHPEALFYFYGSDFDRHSLTAVPHPDAQSFHFIHHPSNSTQFQREVLLLNNIWSANIFASKELYLRYPYRAIDKNTGYGIEDWSWNIETVWADVAHCIVEDTVHIIRIKNEGSLGQQNTVEGLLPYVPPGVQPRFGSI